MRRMTIGELTHSDFGKVVCVPGHAPGVLWSIEHVAAFGDIPQPWTRLLLAVPGGGGSEGTRGLDSATVVQVRPLSADEIASTTHTEEANRVV